MLSTRFAPTLDIFDPFLPSTANSLLTSPFFTSPMSSSLMTPSLMAPSLMAPSWTGENLSLGAMDFFETPTDFEYHADVPGMTSKNVKVQIVDGNMLKISGERERKEKVDTGDYRRTERSYGKFSRSFRLPANADPAKIKANVADGVLTVAVAKAPIAEAAKAAIQEVPVK
jgi:HSP20 family protein